VYFGRYFALLLLCGIQFSAKASNASYIAISNDMAKQSELEVLSNNAANANTIGYEQDDIIYETRNHKESKRKTDAFVVPKGNYHGGEKGGLKSTGRNLDMAIIGNGYFKILTPKGPRYTLAGDFMINNQRQLVTSEGYPVASQVGQPIVVPDQGDYNLLDIAKDGTIYADLDQIDIIGVFGFPKGAKLFKEGSTLYAASTADIILDPTQATILTGTLRMSNVSTAKVMTNMIASQRAADASRKLVTDLANLERGTISKVMK
jgi:flagellar basal-body rod protein FlgF